MRMPHVQTDHMDPPKVPAGVDMTLAELQEMAARQQQKVEQQQQLLVAKEQRLKFLKQQEQRHLGAPGQGDRLRRMRGRVEVLEAKLRKIRSQRGDAVQVVDSNATLASELESMKTLFFEKEKQLAAASSRADQLSQQLADAKMGRVNGNGTGADTAAAEFLELERLRKDLMLRNKMNEQQNTALASHHGVLKQRKTEMSDLDKKIAELKQRVKNKKEASPDGQHGGPAVSSNVVAVEPYKHTVKPSEDEVDKVQALNKHDPKYQTLPHSIKFKDDNVQKPISKDINIYDGLKARRAFFENNNMGDAGVSRKDPEEVKVNGTDHNGPTSKSEAGPGQRKATPPSYQSVMGLAAKQGSQSSYGKEMPMPPNTTAEVKTSWPQVTSSTRISSLMTNFAPRPYGSTFSTSGNSAKPSTVNMSSSILSPRSAGDVPSPKTSTPIQQNGGYDNMGKPLASTNTAGQPYTRAGSEPPVSNLSVTSSGPGTQPGVQHGSISTGAQSAPLPSTPSVAPSQVKPKDSQAPVLGSAMARLLGTAAPSSATGTKPMYASKSVIANTYMRRLSPNAMDQYRKNMSQIYQGLGSGGLGEGTAGQGQPSGSPTARVRPMNMDSQAGGTEDNGYPANGSYNKDASPYNIDPVKFRPNMPRVHRRRSSSGDSPQSPEHRNQLQRQPSEDDDVFSKTGPVDPTNKFGIQPDLVTSNSNVRTIKITHKQDDGVAGAAKDRSERLPLVLRRKKGNLKTKDSTKNSRRVSFDPLALLLDASLEGELELVKKSAQEVPDPSCPNDEGITALHNAICAGHYEIVKFLVEYGCNVNAPDSDGWTPLHCAASCNNLPMVKVLVEHGACIFATTISDQETACAKCEEDEDGFKGCSEYLYNIQEKLGVMNAGAVYAVFDYKAQNLDELNFVDGDKLTVMRKGDETESEWWWAKKESREGYIPRNLFGLYPRVRPQWLKD